MADEDWENRTLGASEEHVAVASPEMHDAIKRAMSLPKAYGGCTCACHRTPGMVHFAPCCTIDDEKRNE